MAEMAIIWTEIIENFIVKEVIKSTKSFEFMKFKLKEHFLE
jgi:hypothetical protein